MTSAALPVGPLLEGSLGNNPLAAEPAASTGALIGYARVATGGQRLGRPPAMTPERRADPFSRPRPAATAR
ncbi:hypothetical protein GCM10023195_08040 [Actinoallomurus liliacearum]|uniref:Resolvase/invertase-type recombinase catalytic domain-containing protein n=1 Tax=Actinoallomurus liliacearum TaxID=1080073 RepID=A0ABP8TAI4_9ACTN